MKKRLIPVCSLLTVMMLASLDADARGIFRPGRQLAAPYVVADTLLLRPFGLAMTVAGSALLVATSPFLGMATIAPPHDAFEQAGKALVIGPAAFTFERPLGEISYERSGVYRDNTLPWDRPNREPSPISPRLSRNPATGSESAGATPRTGHSSRDTNHTP